jgi:uncharacterized membrane protein
MTAYLWIKLIHILSATILFGTGLGTAFFLLKAYWSNSDTVMLETSKHVVQADWFFTTPAVIVQLLTGLWLTQHLAISFTSPWFIAVIGVYAFVGACWIPVVWIQIRISRLIQEGASRDAYRTLMRAWMALGVPAFAGVLALFFLMVSKYGAYT